MFRRLLIFSSLWILPALAQVVIIDGHWPRIPMPRPVPVRSSHLLKKDSGLILFLLPLGTAKHSAKPVENFSVTVNIASSAAIRTVYSPTHQVDISRPDTTHAVSKLTLHNVTNPDDL